MKAQFKVKPSLIIELEGEKQTDLFGALAQAFEVFGEDKCGMCGSDKIKPAVRTVAIGKKTANYHEWVCLNPSCRAKLTLSQNAEGGTMFANRRLMDNGKPATGEERSQGKFGKTNGWTKYRGEGNEEHKAD